VKIKFKFQSYAVGGKVARSSYHFDVEIPNDALPSCMLVTHLMEKAQSAVEEEAKAVFKRLRDTEDFNLGD